MRSSRRCPFSRLAIASLVLLAAGCAAPIEATSLLGEPLRRPALAPALRAQRIDDLLAARARVEAEPDDPDAWIWVGRRTAYLGRYRDAIELYSQGLERHPDCARLYRHRGHRHLTVRAFDAAIADLEHAVALIEGTPDQVEPDGIPNARGIPTSTLHFNVWYHLGLAYFLKGEHQRALRCYRACMDVSNNPDARCATTHWLYMTLRRLGRDDEARRAIEPITADLDVIENDGYHRLCLFYRGRLARGALVGTATDDGLLGAGVGDATVGFGVAHFDLVEGRTADAHTRMRAIVDGGAWAAFGAIAAEAELARAATTAQHSR